MAWEYRYCFKREMDVARRSKPMECICGKKSEGSSASYNFFTAHTSTAVCAAHTAAAIFVPHFDEFPGSLHYDWKTRLGAGHLTQSAAHFICNRRFRIDTDGLL